MADFYKPKDVRELVKFRKILFIGDSNVRPLYKDLLCAINKKRLTSIDILKNPDVDSYFGDIAIQQCGKKTTWSFWENRIYEERGCRVEMFCTGQIIMDVIKGFLRRLPSSLPDIVYLSYGPSHWKNRRQLLLDILSELKLNFPSSTSFIVGSGFPTTTDSFGDPIFDDIPYFIKCNIVNDDENNMAIIDATSTLGFTYLNLAFYLRKGVFRGVASQPGWESVVVRYTTFLLLTSMAQNLLIKFPGRADQELLTKAIDSCGVKLDNYRLQLLKISEYWIYLKSNVPVDELADPAAKNAKEILEKLWRVYRHSRGQISKSRLNNKYHGSKSKKPHKAVSDRQMLMITSSTSTLPRSITTIDISDSRRDAVLIKDHQKTDHVSTEKKEGIATKIEGNEPPGTDNDLEPGECDTESLEEGEIREPPRSTPPRDHDQLFSDISGSGDNVDDDDDTEKARGRSVQIRETQQTTCHIQTRDFPSTSNNPPRPFTIVISDEDTDGEEAVLTYKSNQDAIINLDSDDSDATVGKNPSHTTTKASSNSVSKSSVRRRKELILKPDHVNDNLYLRDKNGDFLSWPTNLGILSGDSLWKWWRTYIQIKNDYSLIICPKEWPEVHVRIPALFSEKGNIAVPKVIDDLKQFFQSMKNIIFSDDCLVDYVEGTDDNKNEPTVKPLPLVEELSRGNENRVQFQITPKGAFRSSLPKAHVSVCSFASYRHFTARHCNAVPGAPEAATEQPKTCVARPEPSHQPSNTNFYAYGDQNISLPEAVYPKQNWTPCSSWVSTSSETGKARKERRKSVVDRRRKRSRSPLLRSYSLGSPPRRRSRTPSPYSKRRHNSRRPQP